MRSLIRRFALLHVPNYSLSSVADMDMLDASFREIVGVNING